MNRPIIEARGLCKQYRLGALGIGSLREELNDLSARLRGRQPSRSKGRFWALKDVTFDVGAGEVIGIIGRNGAGKSTLLKIISRITEPTEGEVTLRGRVASLLEVGTGFHPELSGRENIYLNGAILGMTKTEISRKFDEIVAFSEVETFLDTPVKRYSSGMFVRLAFAVAAHLEPEILVVDEVLAVGDQVFQKKCLGKMGQVAREGGRTVLFVSHNLGAVSSLTRKCLLLNRGRLVMFGNTPGVVQRYLSDTFARVADWENPRPTEFALQVDRLRLVDMGGVPGNEFEVDEGFVVELEYVVRRPVRDALIELWLFSSDGSRVMTLGDYDTRPELRETRSTGYYRSRVRIPGDLLNAGSYHLVLNSALGTPPTTFDYHEVATFEMVEHQRWHTRSGRGGYISPLIPWEIEEIAPETAWGDRQTSATALLS